MNKRKVQLRQSAHQAYLSSIPRVAEQKPPNIVLIFVDDMGYGDLSCFGSQAIHTPNLDAMAEDGVRLNNFYASSPVCSPSRFAPLLRPQPRLKMSIPPAPMPPLAQIPAQILAQTPRRRPRR